MDMQIQSQRQVNFFTSNVEIHERRRKLCLVLKVDNELLLICALKGRNTCILNMISIITFSLNTV